MCTFRCYNAFIIKLFVWLVDDVCGYGIWESSLRQKNDIFKLYAMYIL